MLCLFIWVSPIQAESTKAKELEDAIPVPNKQAADLNALKRAKVTEEQAINQLKFMMVKGFSRMEKELVEKGDFPPFGLSLFPDGSFKAVTIDSEIPVPNEEALAAVAQSMAAIAKTRSTWGVGIMYIRAQKLDDGSFTQRIIVMTEHIAGWARHWAYPFKVENGEVKLGKPTETAVNPIYYVNK
tara:strand:- start:12863 stop:13417 length:555 start_codon:yes stop_codon:yes gene_type:complete